MALALDKLRVLLMKPPQQSGVSIPLALLPAASSTPALPATAGSAGPCSLGWDDRVPMLFPHISPHVSYTHDTHRRHDHPHHDGGRSW